MRQLSVGFEPKWEVLGGLQHPETQQCSVLGGDSLQGFGYGSGERGGTASYNHTSFSLRQGSLNTCNQGL